MALNLAFYEIHGEITTIYMKQGVFRGEMGKRGILSGF